MTLPENKACVPCLFMCKNKFLRITNTGLLKKIPAILIVSVVFFFTNSAYSQSGFCNQSEPFCTDDILTFPAGVNTGSAETGPDYGCLGTQPNPAWYHMRIAVPGDLDIEMYSTPSEDIDFICWGPFTDPHAPCANQLTASAIVDCSFSSGSVETCNISNTQIGEYYILLITNYSNDPCAITFEKVGGAGETDCNIVPSAATNNGPLCVGETLELYAEPVNNATYSWTGPNGFTSNIQNPAIPDIQMVNAGVYNLIVNLGGTPSNPFPTEVFIYENPVADFSFNNVCEGTEIQFNDLSTCATVETPINTWLWDFGDGNFSTDQNPAHTYASGGPLNYDVTLQVETTGGCTNTITQSVSIFPNPVALFTYDFMDGSSCIDSQVQFSDQSTSSQGNITSWNWDFGDSQTSNEQNPVHSYSSPGTFTVSLIVENENGCDSIFQSQITINDFPDIDFSFTEVCNGTMTEFIDSDHINVGATSEWLYDFGDGNSSTVSDPSHLYSVAGNYNVSFTIVDTNGCSNSIQHSVPVFESPIAGFTFDTTCLFSPTHLTDLSQPSSGIDYWNWDLGDGNSSIQQNVIHVYSEPAIYYVELIVGNNDGCADTIGHSVQVWEPPVANFQFSDSSCTTGLIYFNDSSYSNESEIDNLIWYFPDGHISYDPNTYFVFLNTEIFYDVSLYVEDIRGCSDTLTEDIFIDPELQMSFNADTVCFGDETTLGAYIVKPEEDSIVQYTWSFRDGSAQITTSNDTVLHTFTEPGNFEVMLQSMNLDGCLDIIRKNVKVRANPESDFSFTESNCNDSSWFVDESEKAEGNLVYWKWKYGNGDSLEVHAPDNPDHYYFYPPLYETYETGLYIQDEYGCRDSAQHSLTHFPCVIVNHFLDSSWICNNTPAVFIDSSIVDPDYQITKKTWFFGDGESFEADPDTDTIYYQYQAYGTYNSKLIIEYQINQINVKDSSERIVKIQESPHADFSVDDVCYGSHSVFNNQTHLNNIELKRVHWHFGDGQDTIFDYVPGQNEITHLYMKDTTYIADFWVIAENNCEDSVSRHLSVHPNPEIGFKADSTIFCGNAQVVFKDTSQINNGFISNRLWTFGDGDFISSDADTVTHEYEEGVYSVTLENISDKFCTSSLTLGDYILINPIIEASFDIEPREISISNKNQLEVINFVAGETHLMWSLSDSIFWENLSIPNIADSISDTGTYQLKQYTINEFGCTDSLWAWFKITPAYSFYVPSAFSPNNNGLNDTWGPIGKYFDMDTYDLKIFSRWGEIIFHSNNFFEHWDGKLKNGSIAPIGPYAYIIRLTDMDGNHKIMKGSVVLLL